MELDQTLKDLTLAAVDDAYKAKVRSLYSVFDDALVAAEDDTDIGVAEERLQNGLEKAVDAWRRTRRIADLEGG